MGHVLVWSLAFLLLNTLLCEQAKGQDGVNGYDDTSNAQTDRPQAHLTMDTTSIDQGFFTLTCSVKPPSSEWTYYWYRGNRVDFHQTTVSHTTVFPGGTYQCRGGRGDPVHYSEYSNSVVAHRVVLTLDPNWSEIFYGEAFTLRCEIQDGGNTGWTYEWTKDTLNRPTTTNEYRITRATTAHRGSYRCRGRTNSSVTTEWSNVIELTVADRPQVHLTMDTTSIDQGSVTLTCSVSSSLSGWKYYWEKDNTDYYRQTTYSQISVSSGGTYQCRGGKGYPVHYSEYSNSVVIHRVVLTLDPNWSEIFYREAFTLRCEIQDGGNTGWTYEWKKDTINRPTTTNEYRISNATTAHRGSYRCRGRTDSSVTTVWSNVIKLTVADRPKTQLSMSPASINQESVSLTCSVSSSSGWKYYWYKDKSLYKPQHPQLYSDHPLITVSPGGTYQCRGGRGDPVYYSDYSNSVVTNIPVVTLKSSWSEIFHLETVTLRCEITDGGDTEWVYEWSTSGTKLPQEQSEYLTITVDFNDRRRYCCKGKHKEDENMETEWSNSMSLQALSQKPQAHLISDTTSIQQGSSVTLTCSVRSSSGWKYYWYKDNTLYKPHTTQDFSDNPQISISVGGSYRCRGGRGNPVYYTYYSNTVSISTIVSNGAVVTLDPNWSEIYTGEKITLRCEIHRGDTEWEYEWRKSDSALSETESEIRITKAHSRLTGDYSCRGKMKQSQHHLTNWSDKVTLTVSVGKPTSVLTVSPSWLSPGASVTLKCHVKPPSAGWRFYWYKAVPHPSDELYRYELLPDSSEGTEQEVFTIHGQKNTTGYVCRAGRGDPQFYSEYSRPKFTWCGDMDSSVSLRVSPNKSQHFTSESISLSCETNSDKRRVRQFYENSYSNCNYYSWRTDTSPCIISWTVYNGAVFWCESGSGEFSNAVNISTHDYIIIESPVHPVTEGQPLILSCRLWTDGILTDASFYKNGKLIQTGTSGQLNISAVSKSDEGFYQCERTQVKSLRPQVWKSSESWVSVKSGSVVESPPFPVWFVIGPICGILLIILLFLLCRYNSYFIRWFRCPCSPKSSQSSAADHMMNQTEPQHDPSPSPLHADAFLYDSIKDNGDSGGGGPSDITYSSIELKNMKGAKKQKPGEECTVYSEVKPKPAADDNVVYAQVHAHGKGKAKRKKGKASPGAPEETVYSAVKYATQK